MTRIEEMAMAAWDNELPKDSHDLWQRMPEMWRAVRIDEQRAAIARLIEIERRSSTVAPMTTSWIAEYLVHIIDEYDDIHRSDAA